MAIIRDRSAVAEDCATVEVAILTVSAPRRACTAPVVLHAADLRRGGTHVLTLPPGGGVRLETVEAWRGDRPWSQGNSR